MSMTTPAPIPTARAEKPPRPSRTLGLGARERTRPLPAHALACRSCGVAVASPPPERVEVLRTSLVDAGQMLGLRPSPQAIEVRVSRCDDCTARWARAEALVSQYRLGRVFGNIAPEHADAALAALDLLGIRGDRTNSLTTNAANARGLLEALAHVGSAATWAARFLPVLTQGAEPDGCAPRRWAHVSAEHVQTVAEEYRLLVHRRAELPFPFSPPSERGALQGCGFCGVGILRVKESQALEAWGKEFRVNPGVLGGRTRPEPVLVHLCPACRSAVDAVGGAMGLPAVERALMRHLGFTTKPDRTIAFRSVAAWAALRPGTEPSSTPWAHLNLGKFERALDRSHYVQRDPRHGGTQ